MHNFYSLQVGLPEPHWCNWTIMPHNKGENGWTGLAACLRYLATFKLGYRKNYKYSFIQVMHIYSSQWFHDINLILWWYLHDNVWQCGMISKTQKSKMKVGLTTSWLDCILSLLQTTACSEPHSTAVVG